MATLSTSALTAGRHTIDAAYSGDPNFTLSSATLDQMGQRGRQLDGHHRDARGNPSTFGDALTFTATVSGPGGTPTGTVQFSIDGAASGLPVALLAWPGHAQHERPDRRRPHDRRGLQR